MGGDQTQLIDTWLLIYYHGNSVCWALYVKKLRFADCKDESLFYNTLTKRMIDAGV